MPAALCREQGWKDKKPVKPVFFAPTDIQPGELSEELKQRLRDSKNLIVICSPNSAKSEWVGREIKYFCEIGRKDNVHLFIVKGTPNSGNPETECFNPVLNELGMSEVLGANVNEKIYKSAWLNRERAYVQLITKLLGVEFDSIWQRHKRRLAIKVAAITLGLMAVISALILTWKLNQPFDVRITVEEQQKVESLPPLRNVLVSLFLDNECKTDTVNHAEDAACLTNIPHHFFGEKVKITAGCNRFLPFDTIVVLNENVNVTLKRDVSVFGNVHFTIYDGEKGIPDVKVSLAGIEAVSDSQGVVNLQVPLEKQQVFYVMKTSVPLETDTVFMPCGKDDVIYAK